MKMLLFYSAPFFLLLLTCGCQSRRQVAEEAKAETALPKELDYPAISGRLMERMSPQPGERVLLIGRPGRFDDLIEDLRRRVAEAGATDLGAISVGDRQPSDWSTEFTAGAAGKNGADLVAYFSDVDLGVMMPGATPADAPYAAMQEVLKGGTGRTVHFHWQGAYDLNQHERPIDDEVDALYQKALLNTDYQALAATQRRFEAAMRDREVRVTTPAGTDIRFRTGDRPVTRQDGDASASRMSGARNLIDREVELPAGAIRVAPVEASVNGTIAFPDAAWNGEMVRGLEMTFREGKLVGFKAAEGADGVQAVLNANGEAARSFREFALGFNPLLAIPETGEKWIPYYGYGAGIVRLSLGDNTELGGNVSGGFVRWNFFTDATVTVGEELWVEKGRLMR